MLTSSHYSSAIHSVASSKLYPSVAEREIRARTSKDARSENYDSITLSPSASGRSFHRELVGRLSQEVRTTTTTGDISALRRQVSGGTYTPDAAAIARRILFLGEEP